MGRSGSIGGGGGCSVCTGIPDTPIAGVNGAADVAAPPGFNGNGGGNLDEAPPKAVTADG